MRKRLTGLLTLLLLSAAASATHIVGGVMNYKCLGNNSYEVTLKVFRDCINGQVGFDNPAAVGIYDGNGVLQSTLLMYNPVVTVIPPAINNPCFSPPGNVCVEEGVYKSTITLSPNSSGYYLTYQRCCRNGTIMNIFAPGNTGSSYFAFVPPASQFPCNSNPVYTAFPPIFLCVNVPFVFDHSAIDVDGDSLVYELCEPVDGASQGNPMPNPPSPPPYNAVQWNSVFSSAYPITSNPAISINSQSGNLTLTPTQLGQFVVGVCVKEYRNGVLVSSTLRDFQFNVVNCPGLVVASFPGQSTVCNGLNVNFSNNSVNATTYHWDFGIPTLINDTSNLANPSYTFPAPGTYTVTLIAEPYTLCADTSTSVFTLNPPISPGFINQQPQCKTGNSFDFVPTGTFSSSATFSWTFQNGSPATSSQKAPSNVSFSGIGSKNVTITIVDQGCTETFTGTILILPDPVAVIKPQTQFCKGNTIDFFHQSINSNTFSWDFGDTLTNSDTSSLANPTYTYSDTGTYVVRLVTSNGICSDTVYRTFSILPLLEVKIYSPDTAMCLEGNSFDFFATGSYEEETTLLWQFGNLSNKPFANGDSVIDVRYDSAGAFGVTLTAAGNGCSSTDYYVVHVYPHPTAYFEPIPPGCAPYEVEFIQKSTGGTTLFFDWDLGDGTLSHDPFPIHTYTEPGVYDISLLVYTKKGCIDSAFYERPSAIQVYPRPESNFTADPLEASIFDPRISVQDASSGHIRVTYDFGDGQSENWYSGAHFYLDTGTFTIVHRAFNEFGCVDSTARVVSIYPGHIPNTFSPNTDTKNEVFFPVFLTASGFRMEIYNRWGERIFVSEELETGWDGTYLGRPAQQDVYVYKIQAASTNGRTYFFSGHVNLVR